MQIKKNCAAQRKNRGIFRARRALTSDQLPHEVHARRAEQDGWFNGGQPQQEDAGNSGDVERRRTKNLPTGLSGYKPKDSASQALVAPGVTTHRTTIFYTAPCALAALFLLALAVRVAFLFFVLASCFSWALALDTNSCPLVIFSPALSSLLSLLCF